MTEKNTILSIENLNVQYETDAGVVKAVNGVSFSLEKGKTIGLVGETGAGKTSIALSIMQLLQSPPAQITSGKILFEGDDLLTRKPDQMRKVRGKKISMIFQDPMTALNPIERVGDQIAEVLRIHEKLSRKDAALRAIDLLEMVGIPGERSDEYPHQFSGGMKQRIVIAIALACQPDLLIADEPTTALDVTIQAQVLDLIKNLQEKLGTSVILITHDLGVVAETCDQVAVVYAGEVIELGEARHIFDETGHPYTKGLFGSLPNIHTATHRLTPIPGLMPDPTELPVGCSFADRCPHAREQCRAAKPEPVEVSEGHIVKCILARERQGE